MRDARFVCLVLAALAPAVAPAGARQEPTAAELDPELRAHLDELRRQIDDPATPEADRAKLAVDAVATLDRAALATSSEGRRRAAWSSAARFLDRFRARYPSHPRDAGLALQAAGFRWAIAHTWAEQWERDPAAASAHSRAVDSLEAVCDELRDLRGQVPPAPDELSDILRDRLARALLDRALVETTAGDRREVLLSEALAELRELPQTQSLRGHALLLRASILNELRRYEPALDDVRQARRSAPPLIPAVLAEIESAALIGLGRFEEATAVCQDERLDEATRARLAMRLSLARRERATTEPDRRAAETDAYAQVAALSGDEARTARMELARSIAEPDPTQPPESWVILADGRHALGDRPGAARLLLGGARRADALGDHPKAGPIRYRAASILHEAGRFQEAATILRPLRDDPDGAADLRSRTGMLLALSLAPAAPQSAAGAGAYVKALEEQIALFPDEAVTDEARLRLGHIRYDEGDHPAAIAQWESVPAGHPSWLAARLAVFRLLLEELEATGLEAPVNPRQELGAIRRLLSSIEHSGDDPGRRLEVDLARLRLELSDRVNGLEEAQMILDRLVALPMRPDQHCRRNGYQAVWLLRKGRYGEAERSLSTFQEAAGDEERAELLRFLDRLAVGSESDVLRRRIGSMMLELLPGQGTGSTKPSVSMQLYEARARIARGDGPSAVPLLDSLDRRRAALDDEQLSLLARAWLQIDATDRAVAVLGERARRQRPGRTSWLDARYDLAVAYQQSGRADLARRLIDATALLHPEMGGPDRRARFEALRRRIEDR
jgi:tetratricopeptide (TPR) repeat protein